MKSNYNIQRFLDAQSRSYESALIEIKKGHKQGHWMWYIFPQIIGLGKSETAIFYSIKSKEEALEYFSHPILGNRLIEISKESLKIKKKSAKDIFGWIDARKLKSSMSLFALIQIHEPIFQKVLDKYFEGRICRSTKSKLQI